jgi:tetratricopeptide (TPR) repeat protein
VRDSLSSAYQVEVSTAGGLVSDDKRLLISAMTILVVASLAFAAVVVLATRSGLGLKSGDPLLNGSALPAEECGELLASASKAVDSDHEVQALEALRLVESLRCAKPFLARSAQLYRAMGRPGDAIRLLRGLLSETPEDPELLCAVAEALHEAGYADSARTVLVQTAALPGLESTTVRSLAWMALSQGESLLAESLFSRALAIEPDDPELWRALSQIRLNIGKALPAKEAALRALELDPALCSARLSLGWAHEALGEIAEAESTFRQACSICPNDPTVSFESGRFYFRAGQNEEAVRMLRQAVAEVSAPLDWLLLLARAEQQLGESSAARQTLKLACNRHQDDYRPYFLLAKLERRAGNVKQSRDLAETARAQAPENSDVIRFIATLPG